MNFPPPRCADPQVKVLWLLDNFRSVTNIDDVGVFYAKLDSLTRRIERAIDRPQQPRTCGPCPTIVGSSRQECATALEARHGQHEVTCPACRQTYNTEQLITRTFNGLHYKTFTVRELVDTVLPRMEEPVPQKTLERWIRDDRVPVRGYNAAGHQMVQLEDVRRVRAQRPRHAKQAG